MATFRPDASQFRRQSLQTARWVSRRKYAVKIVDGIGSMARRAESFAQTAGRVIKLETSMESANITALSQAGTWEGEERSPHLDVRERPGSMHG